MSGAIDLAAVKARSEAAARAAQAPPPAAGATVVAVDEASFQVPVVLDLWAEWCQPCKQLSPVLEKLAAEGGGKWILATIDVDANQRIAQALQVQSIPTIFAVIGGQVVPGFQGALPEAQVREFIDALLQAATQAGLSGAGPQAASAPPNGSAEAEDSVAPAQQVPSDPRFDAAEAALEAGDFAAAAEGFQAILDAEPANADAGLALRQVHFLSRLSETKPDAVALADAAPDDIELQLAAADVQVSQNDFAPAFDRLIALVTRLRGEDRDPVRNRLVDYFELLGPDEPAVPGARRRLSNALF